MRNREAQRLFSTLIVIMMIMTSVISVFAKPISVYELKPEKGYTADNECCCGVDCQCGDACMDESESSACHNAATTFSPAVFVSVSGLDNQLLSSGKVHEENDIAVSSPASVIYHPPQAFVLI